MNSIFRSLTGLLQRTSRAAATNWQMYWSAKAMARRSVLVRRLRERCQRNEEAAAVERENRSELRESQARELAAQLLTHHTETASLQSELTVKNLEIQHLTGLLERMRLQVEADTAIAVKRTQSLISQGGKGITGP